MKNCPPGEIVSRYLDGELEAAESARLQGHLDSCPRCRKRVEELVRAGDFLRLSAVGDSPPPAHLEAMIEEKFFPRPPEVFLGVIEFDLSTLSAPAVRSAGAAAPHAVLGMAAEPPSDYGPPKGPVEERGYRQAFSGEGIEATVELLPGEKGSAACRIAIRDGAGNPLAGVRLQLEKAGKPVWSFLTRGRQESVIPRLLPGRYRLRIEDGRTYGLVLDLR